MASASRFSFDAAEFAGKRVLVTGGTQGMGEAIVRRLVGSAARVATTARTPLPEGRTVELFVQADISTRQGVDRWQSRPCSVSAASTFSSTVLAAPVGRPGQWRARPAT